MFPPDISLHRNDYLVSAPWTDTETTFGFTCSLVGHVCLGTDVHGGGAHRSGPVVVILHTEFPLLYKSLHIAAPCFAIDVLPAFQYLRPG